MAVGESSLTRVYGPLLTTTLDKVLQSGALQDNVFNKNPFLSKLRQSGNVKVVDGGERLRCQIMHASNSTYKRYSDYEALNTTPQRGFTTAWFNWKQAGISVSISGKELRSNRGRSRISDLQKDKIMQADLSLVDGVSTDVYSDGTADGSNQITGLEAMIDTTPATTTYADIDPANNSAWRNQVQTSIGAAAVNFLPKLRTVFNDCSQGLGAPSSPDGIFTTQAVHEAAEALLFPQVRYSNAGGRRDADGSVNPFFRGVEIQWDDHCPSGTAYVINSQHLMFVIHRDANFGMTEEGFQQPINQDALVALILLQANLVTNNRRKQGKLTGIT